MTGVSAAAGEIAVRSGYPLVSVIIPCYNQAGFLGQAIESVLAQDYRPIELIVVDDGSTDATVEVARRYPGVRCVSQENRGLAAARNAGIEGSSGKFIVFLDADDRLLPGSVRANLSALLAHPECAMAVGTHQIISSDGRLLEAPPVRTLSNDHYAELLRRNFIVMPAVAMHCRWALDRIGFFDAGARGCEDYDLYLRIARCFPVHVHDTPVAEYRRHGSNMSLDIAAMRKSALNVLRSQWKWIDGCADLVSAYKAGVRFWNGYYAAACARDRDTTSVVTTRAVILSALPSEYLEGANVEEPVTAEAWSGHMVELVGWVVGRRSVVKAIEILANGAVCQYEPVDVSRSDVEAHFGGAAGTLLSGFHTWIRLAGLGRYAIVIQAVLRDNTRVPFAELTLERRWRNPLETAEQPLVSVVIPCWNQGRYLGAAIESVLAQSYPNFEIVVVDDGSRDNTAEIASRYPGVQYRHQENAGVAAARNAGIRHSSGQYLVFLDADDRLLPDALAIGIAEYRQQPLAGFVAGRCRLIDSCGAPLGPSRQSEVVADPYTELLRHCFVYPPATAMHRRDVIQDSGGFRSPVDAAADYDMYLRIALQHPVRWHAGVVAEYRRHSANMTGDAARMLSANLAVLRHNMLEARKRPTLLAAYRTGRSGLQTYYGEQLANRARGRTSRAGWLESIRSFATLTVSYPRGIATLLGRSSDSAHIRYVVRRALPPNAIVLLPDGTLPEACLPRAARRRVLHLPCSALVSFCDGPEAPGNLIRRWHPQLNNRAAYLLIPESRLSSHEVSHALRSRLDHALERLWVDDRFMLYRLPAAISVAGADGHSTNRTVGNVPD